MKESFVLPKESENENKKMFLGVEYLIRDGGMYRARNKANKSGNALYQ